MASQPRYDLDDSVHVWHTPSDDPSAFDDEKRRPCGFCCRLIKPSDSSLVSFCASNPYLSATLLAFSRITCEPYSETATLDTEKASRLLGSGGVRELVQITSWSRARDFGYSVVGPEVKRAEDMFWVEGDKGFRGLYGVSEKSVVEGGRLERMPAAEMEFMCEREGNEHRYRAVVNLWVEKGLVDACEQQNGGHAVVPVFVKTGEQDAMQLSS